MTEKNQMLVRISLRLGAHRRRYEDLLAKLEEYVCSIFGKKERWDSRQWQIYWELRVQHPLSGSRFAGQIFRSLYISQAIMDKFI